MRDFTPVHPAHFGILIIEKNDCLIYIIWYHTILLFAVLSYSITFLRSARGGKNQNPLGQFSHKSRPGNSRTRNRLAKQAGRLFFCEKNEKLNFRFWEGRDRPRDCDFRNLRQKL